MLYFGARLVDRCPKRHARRLLQRGEDCRLRLRDACELRDVKPAPDHHAGRLDNSLGPLPEAAHA